MGLADELTSKGIKPFSGAEEDVTLFFLNVEARMTAAGINVDAIYRDDDGSTVPHTVSAASASAATTATDAAPAASSPGTDGSAPASAAALDTIARDPRNPRVDAAIFAFLLPVLQGHPLNLVTTDNQQRSGVTALRRLKERYLHHGKDHVNRLKQRLRNMAWGPADDIDSFMGRLVDIHSRLSMAGFETPQDDLHLIVSNCLPKEFDVALRFLLREEPPPSLSKITRELVEEERRLGSRKAPAVLAVAAPKPPKAKDGTSCCPPRSKVTCAFCNMSGHCAQQCFKLQAAKKHNLINISEILGTLRSNSKRNHRDGRPGSSPKGKRDQGSRDSDVTCMVSHSCSLASAALPADKCLWLADTGATAHITNMLSNLIDPVSYSGSLTVANDNKADILARGNVKLRLQAEDGREVFITLKDVLFVPSIKYNLIALSLVHKGSTDASVLLSASRCVIQFPHFSIPLWDLHNSGHLFVKCEPVPPIATAACAEEVEDATEHELMGHRSGHQEMLRSIASRARTEVHCEPCELGKSTRASIAKKSAPRTAAPCKLIYADMAGPVQVPSLRNARFAIAFIDDATRFAWTFLIKRKSDACHALEQLRKERHMLDGLRGAMLQTDSDSVFKGKEFTDTCALFEIKQRFAAPNSQARNGSVERAFRTLFDTGRTMMIASGLEPEFWGFSVQHATLIHNISHRAGQDQTPYEKLTGHPFDTSVLRVFGTPAFVHVEKTGRRKLDQYARRGVYVGFSEEDQAHVVWIRNTKVAIHTIHVRFGPPPKGDGPAIEEVSSDSGVVLSMPALTSQVASDTSAPAAAAPAISPLPPLPAVSETPAPEASSPPAKQTVWSMFDDMAFQAAEDKTTPTVGQATSPDSLWEPSTIEEALGSSESDQWRHAITDELSSMEANEVFERIPKSELPKGTKLLRSKLVFTKKTNEHGKIVRYKVRWVAKGFSQVKGVNYDETFAPTAAKTAIRNMLAMATSKRMFIQQMDVKTAFLNAPLDHVMYVAPPPVDDFEPGIVLKLKRSLYGLKQSPRLWNHTLNEWMVSEGFAATATDACIYTKTVAERNIWVAVYVDDLLIFTDSEDDMKHFKSAISGHFDMKDIGDPDLCLNVKLTYNRDEGTLVLTQEHYLRQVLETYGMSDCKQVSTPLSTGYRDQPAPEGVPSPDVPFREVIGSLLYASTTTRPDISAAVSILCRHMQHFSQDHWVALKHLLRYIKGTIHYRIVFSADDDGAMTGYCDASHASDAATLRSRTGYVLMRSNGPISWASKLQQIVATASADAEYMAMAMAAKEIMFIRQLEDELLGRPTPPTVLHTDSQPAMQVAKRCATRMRHILIKFHFIRDCVDSGLIQLQYLQTDSMVADLLTKILGKPKTVQFCKILFK